jgi:hypothetical protein
MLRKKALVFGRFPDFARLSFRLEYCVDEEECEAMPECY